MPIQSFSIWDAKAQGGKILMTKINEKREKNIYNKKQLHVFPISRWLMEEDSGTF